ncbi:MAG: TIGR02281 family clan AA aspartic protease [Paracoccaceae bacterium]
MLPDDPNDLGRLIYLVLLGAAIAAFYLFDGRRRLSQTLQQAMIWGLIFLGFIAVYGFRDTITSQLFPSRIERIGQDRAVLRRAGDGHFYGDVRVNGQSIRFIVDTGATAIVLSQRDAARAGIDTARLDYLGTATTANGTVRTAAVRLERVDFADWTDFDVPAHVSAGEMDGSLLGMSYLSRFSRIEIAGDRLVLTR